MNRSDYQDKCVCYIYAKFYQHFKSVVRPKIGWNCESDDRRKYLVVEP